MDTPYSDKIHAIAVNTFEVTCYMFPLEEWEIEEGNHLSQPDDEVRSIVGFEGAAEGGMVISPSEELLTAIAANMLGVEAPDEQQKTGALCEITNIICGNTVPLFAEDQNICNIQPPRMAEPGEDTDATFEGMNKESLQVLLDEGLVDITVYYSKMEEA
ncbi:chemotaxis protein CheX [Aliifodinibius sp. S!AR15-10]|uniref:chemotaxis protein CheX n=1 Tax=Aliifodinibius sp. S!AR15-10 TaxID=2950437 RepID=UPI002854B3E4|nr:chemotaxis protein CheX [Aliifodinibius sp. S!AR15-10]MDR8392852.1 chemotaxis protein CheX [Aliifodinibius sp. S!AR15-10]